MQNVTTELNRDLTKRIMKRVYWTWFTRSVAPLLGVEAILLTGVLVGVLTHISIKHILMNSLAASADLRAFVDFYVRNFFVKSIQSRLLVVAFAAIVAFFVRDLRNAIRKLRNAGSVDTLAMSVLGNRQ